MFLIIRRNCNFYQLDLLFSRITQAEKNKFTHFIQEKYKN